MNTKLSIDLPTADELTDGLTLHDIHPDLAEAEEEARWVIAEANDATERFREAWEAFLVDLQDLEEVGREVVGTFSDAKDLGHRLVELRREYDLDVEVPDVPSISRGEAKEAGLIASLLQSIGNSQVIDEVADRDLASTRKRAREDAA